MGRIAGDGQVFSTITGVRPSELAQGQGALSELDHVVPLATEQVAEATEAEALGYGLADEAGGIERLHAYIITGRPSLWAICRWTPRVRVARVRTWIGTARWASLYMMAAAAFLVAAVLNDPAGR